MIARKFTAALAASTLLVAGGAGVASADVVYDNAKPALVQTINNAFPDKCEAGKVDEILKKKFGVQESIEGKNFKEVVAQLKADKQVRATFNELLNAQVKKKGYDQGIVKSETREALFDVAVRRIASNGVKCGLLTEDKPGEAEKEAEKAEKENEKKVGGTDVRKLLSSWFTGFSSDLSS